MDVIARAKRWTVAGLFAVGGLLGGPAFAQESPAEVIQAIEAKYGAVKTMRAAFTQTVKSELFGEETESGQVVVKRPKMMRWSFGEEKQFITDGDTMWIYTKPDKQVIRYDDVSGSTTATDSLLQSLDRLDEFFQVEVAGVDAGGHQLSLSPKEGDEGQFKNVKLALDGDLMIKKVVITDQFDNVTDLVFSSVELNVDLADEMFRFTVPDGVEVISASTGTN